MYISRFLKIICFSLVTFFSVSSVFAQVEKITADLEKDKPQKFKTKVLKSERTGEKKFTLPRRIVQNTSSHYNYYFNANNKLNEVIERARLAHRDNYAKLLPFYSYSLNSTKAQASELDSVIYKATAGILLHDLRSEWVDNFYLLIGRAYLLRKDFDSASMTFQFINYNLSPRKKNEDDQQLVGSNINTGGSTVSIANKENTNLLKKLFTKPASRNEAFIWQIRSLTETGEYWDAAGLINTLQNDPNFPSRLIPALEDANAYWFYKQGLYDSAAFHLERALPNAIDQQEKARSEYLLAQLYERTNNRDKATEYYSRASKHTTDPLLDIYANLSTAKMYNVDEPNELDFSIATLLKMAKRDKFEAYRDIVYFSAGEIALQKPDTAAAEQFYHRSLYFNENNREYKNRSFLRLAEIDFSRKKYKTAFASYDSLQLRDTSLGDLAQIRSLRNSLGKIVEQINIIERQDSLQVLALLPEEEREAFVKKLSKRLRKERGLKGDENYNATNASSAFNNNSNNLPELFSNNSQGDWYFYNAAIKSQGFSEFRSRWGKRQNIDNWRHISTTGTNDNPNDNNDNNNNIVDNNNASPLNNINNNNGLNNNGLNSNGINSGINNNGINTNGTNSNINNTLPNNDANNNAFNSNGLNSSNFNNSGLNNNSTNTNNAFNSNGSSNGINNNLPNNNVYNTNNSVNNGINDNGVNNNVPSNSAYNNNTLNNGVNNNGGFNNNNLQNNNGFNNNGVNNNFQNNNGGLNNNNLQNNNGFNSNGVNNNFQNNNGGLNNNNLQNNNGFNNNGVNNNFQNNNGINNNGINNNGFNNNGINNNGFNNNNLNNGNAGFNNPINNGSSLLANDYNGTISGMGGDVDAVQVVEDNNAEEETRKNVVLEDISYAGMLGNVPVGDEKLKASNALIASALFQLGKLFQNELEDYSSAVETYEKSLQRFPDSLYSGELYMNLSYCYQKLGNTAKADFYKNLLTTKFKETNYAKNILNPKPAVSKDKDPKATKRYESIYNLFIEGQFEKALLEKKSADSLYGENYWSPQLLYIEAVYHIKQKNDSLAIIVLSNIINNYPTSPLNAKAANMIDVLSRRYDIENYLTNLKIERVKEDAPIVITETPVNNRPSLPRAVRNDSTIVKPQKSLLIKDSSGALKPSPVVLNGPYSFETDVSQYVVMLLDKVDPVYISEARNAFNRYNRDNFRSTPMDIVKDTLDKDRNFLVFKPFENADAAITYANRLKKGAPSEVSWLPATKYSFFIISEANLQLLKYKKDLPAYIKLLSTKYPGKF